MALLDKLVNDYEVITRTELWGMFESKVRELRSVKSRDCETKENVAKSQGAVDMLDYVLGRGKDYAPLIKRILDELSEETRKEKI